MDRKSCQICGMYLAPNEECKCSVLRKDNEDNTSYLESSKFVSRDVIRADYNPLDVTRVEFEFLNAPTQPSRFLQVDSQLYRDELSGANASTENATRKRSSTASSNKTKPGNTVEFDTETCLTEIEENPLNSIRASELTSFSETSDFVPENVGTLGDAIKGRETKNITKDTAL